MINHGIRFSFWRDKHQIGVVTLYYAFIMEVIWEDALSITKVTFVITTLFPTVVSLVLIRLVELANSGAVVVFALMSAKVLITTVMNIQVRVA